MHKWLARADAEVIGQAATMLFVTLLRVEELSALRRQAKAVVDALDRGEVEDARVLLAATLEKARELEGIGHRLARMDKRGPD
ncbi:MAG: hypothetical protein D6705_14875 [Deltaproteobacteria bacterium]|nr:MAG: hypothetical protein D6705_14875 [Deltaproteobacteria bacterium]